MAAVGDTGIEARPARVPAAPLYAPVADPGPLGLAAFAATTLILSTFNADLIDRAGKPVVLSMALFFGGLAQVLAGMWEFRRNNTFAAVAFTSFGAFWLSYWAFVQFYAGSLPEGDVASQSAGLYLLTWAVFTTYMIVASLRVSVAVAAVFIALAVTFWLLALGDLTTTSNLTKAGGYVGLVTAGLAFYASFAGVVNETWGRTIFPVLSLAPPKPGLRPPEEPMETTPRR